MDYFCLIWPLYSNLVTLYGNSRKVTRLRQFTLQLARPTDSTLLNSAKQLAHKVIYRSAVSNVMIVCEQSLH